MSERYEAPRAEVVKFNNEDIICTSGCTIKGYTTIGTPQYNR